MAGEPVPAGRISLRSLLALLIGASVQAAVVAPEVRYAVDALAILLVLGALYLIHLGIAGVVWTVTSEKTSASRVWTAAMLAMGALELSAVVAGTSLNEREFAWRAGIGAVLTAGATCIVYRLVLASPVRVALVAGLAHLTLLWVPVAGLLQIALASAGC